MVAPSNCSHVFPLSLVDVCFFLLRHACIIRSNSRLITWMIGVCHFHLNEIIFQDFWSNCKNGFSCDFILFISFFFFLILSIYCNLCFDRISLERWIRILFSLSCLPLRIKSYLLNTSIRRTNVYHCVFYQAIQSTFFQAWKRIDKPPMDYLYLLWKLRKASFLLIIFFSIFYFVSFYTLFP